MASVMYITKSYNVLLFMSMFWGGEKPGAPGPTNIHKTPARGLADQGSGVIDVLEGVMKEVIKFLGMQTPVTLGSAALSVRYPT